MKKIVSLVLALSMVLGVCASVFAGLSDIAGTKYAGAVEALVELGVVNGYPTGDYKPENEVNRAELAKMIVVCMGLEEDADRAQYQTSFADDSLTEGGNFAWARGYVNTAAAAGVIKGYPDGTFGPERVVTYAEAVTMMLRALGYGNVMEAEGTWPTNALLKANELDLFDDVEFTSSNQGATRGDVAILLWNMLRTPMWKITSENQGTGMTSEMSKLMLNVKFPNYSYVEDYYLYDVTIDDDEVTAIVCDEDDEVELEGALLSGDLVRMVEGMKVSALYNNKTEEFLMLHCEDVLVEGFVEESKTSGKVKIDGKEYKCDRDFREDFMGEYVVAVLDGKTLDEERTKVLNTRSTLVEKASREQNKLDEDAIVMLDGVWGDREDLEEGDLYTECTEFGDSYYVIGRERIKGEFEALSFVSDEDDSRANIEVDGEVYRMTVEVTMEEVMEDDDDNEEVTVDDLKAKKEDNKYLGADVELVLDHLGNVRYVYFIEVDPLEKSGSFYALTSDGSWDSSNSKGRTWYVELSGDTYEAAKKGESDVEDFADIEYYESLEGEDGHENIVFVYTKLDTNGKIKSMENLAEIAGGLTEDEKYCVESFSEEFDEDDPYIDYGTGKIRVNSSTVVLLAKPVEDDDDIVGVEVERLSGPEALDGIEAGYVAWENEDGVKVADFVFVTEESVSSELHFAKVTKIDDRREDDYKVYLDGSKRELDYDESERFEVGNLVGYTETSDDKVVVKVVITVEDLADGNRVEEIKKGNVKFVDELNIELEGSAELDPDEDGYIDFTDKEIDEALEDYQVVLAEANVNKNNEIVFENGVDETTMRNLKKNDIVLELDYDEKVIVVVRGLDEEDLELLNPEEPEDPEEPGEDPEGLTFAYVCEDRAILDRTAATNAVKALVEAMDESDIVNGDADVLEYAAGQSVNYVVARTDDEVTVTITNKITSFEYDFSDVVLADGAAAKAVIAPIVEALATIADGDNGFEKYAKHEYANYVISVFGSKATVTITNRYTFEFSYTNITVSQDAAKTAVLADLDDILPEGGSGSTSYNYMGTQNITYTYSVNSETCVVSVSVVR